MEHLTVRSIREFQKLYNELDILKPLKVNRYLSEESITYKVALMLPSNQNNIANVTLDIEGFIGGGFAGQVYKVRVTSIEGVVTSLRVGQSYALKIFIPPSYGALFFRNLLYSIGFQGAFQVQCNPSAARAGALWQIFIRRAAVLRFNDENAVNNIHGTFIDPVLGSCGEISDWIEGRTWKLEIDDQVDLLLKFEKRKSVSEDQLGSPEYRSKKRFMQDFVSLLHEMGAHEFARQYEWSTWKSQPNVLKRLSTESDPEHGLTAVDFRAGLTLLPFLPLSPGDIKLIFQGFKRKSLVQFDRGDVTCLEAFIKKNESQFKDLLPLLGDLKSCEKVYRQAVPDITHNHIRLLHDKELHKVIYKSTVLGWKVQNKIDSSVEEKLYKNKLFFFVFYIMGLIPFLGSFIRNFLGLETWRNHYYQILKDFQYFKRSFLASRIENLIFWLQNERVTPDTAEKIYRSAFLYIYHLFLRFLPKKIHRALSDRQYFIDTFYNVMFKPFHLYMNAELREEWLRDLVREGERSQILSKEDVRQILSQIHETYIHKYLQSMTVHILLAPITRIISIGVVVFFLLSHPEMSRLEALAVTAGIFALFQVIPISPGSFARGLYVLLVVIREKNLKDYNIALPLSFFKYIGYFSFPIQMTYRYPTLVRFMASFMTSRMVGVVPVFGEKGALLEHKIFTLSYNWPLTIRRKFWYRKDIREAQQVRSWHIAPIAIIFGILYGLAEYFYLTWVNALPSLLLVNIIFIGLGVLVGVLINSGSGGASSLRRVMFAVIGGLIAGVLATVTPYFMDVREFATLVDFIIANIWNSFVVATFASIGATLKEFSF